MSSLLPYFFFLKRRRALLCIHKFVAVKERGWPALSHFSKEFYKVISSFIHILWSSAVQNLDRATLRQYIFLLPIQPVAQEWCLCLCNVAAGQCVACVALSWLGHLVRATNHSPISFELQASYLEVLTSDRDGICTALLHLHTLQLNPQGNMWWMCS
jgi:hypothetical protein